MAAGLVGQSLITTFTTPVNGSTPIDANTCRGNDNTIKTAYNIHDDDGTIHLQSSTLAARPAFGTAGRKWMSSDGLRIYYDTGAAWSEAAYLPLVGGAVTGATTIQTLTVGLGSGSVATNTAFGYQALLDNTTGSNCTAIGYHALQNNTTGTDNTALGYGALDGATTGTGNTALGSGAATLLTTGLVNTAVGTDSLRACVTGSGNVAVGYFAGRYETGSNAFYVDNQDRTNTAGDKAKALLYGTFNATAASQTLVVNAAVTLPYTLAVTGNFAVNTTNLTVNTGTGAVAIGNGSLTVNGGFGCNGEPAQTKYASGGTLAGVVAALVANGILSN